MKFKHLPFFFLITLSAVPVFSQNIIDSAEIMSHSDTVRVTSTKTIDSENSQEKLREKLAGYTRMERNGKTLFNVGLPLTIAGFLSYVGSALTLSDGNKNVGVPLAVIAVAGIGFGPEMIVAGVVLKKIGKNKKIEFENKLSIKIGLNGVSLNYSF
jgi:hypothetical protein